MAERQCVPILADEIYGDMVSPMGYNTVGVSSVGTILFDGVSRVS